MPAVQIIFRKDAAAQFLSHLDLLATLEYAMRRAHLPLELSEGFSPRPRMTLAAPLALGYIGAREILDISLREQVNLTEVQQSLQSALPAGITILSTQTIPEGQKPAASRVQGSIYRVRIPQPVANLDDRVEALLRMGEAWIVEKREKGTRRRNVRPLLESVTVENNCTLRVAVTHGPDGTTRPEHILELLDVPADGALITRECIVLRD